MQGLKEFVPTDLKVKYLNNLLKVGFEVLDFGSFVSPKAIPQMADTAEVLSRLDMSATDTKLLAIVANLRGAEQALAYDAISYTGFPLSVSETFQQRNTNKSIAQALAEVAEIQDLCLRRNMHLVVYLSMAFGNPYGDAYNPEQVSALCDKLNAMDIKHIALSDTTGVSTADNIGPLFRELAPKYPKVQFAAHLHTRPEDAAAKVRAAYEAGCRRFDAALKGYGGCPMAADTLTGNMDTELMIAELESLGEKPSINRNALDEAGLVAAEVFA